MKVTDKQVKIICKTLKLDFLKLSFLAKGEHNLNYLIKTKQDKFVLRVENNFQFKNLKTEYKFLKKTKGRLGPKVFLFDDSHKIIAKDYMIQEFIEGKHPKREVTSKFIKAMALWYKKLHKDRIKKSPRPFNKKDGVKRYKKYQDTLDGNLKKKVGEIYLEIKKTFEEDNLYSKIKYLSLNHGDPSRMNIFYDNGSVRLIDWEFVGYDLPEADLTFFVWSYELNNRQKKLFLDTYGYSKSKRLFNLIMSFHIFAMLTWRVERLHLFNENKIQKSQYPSSKKQIYKDINDDINKIREVLE